MNWIEALSFKKAITSNFTMRGFEPSYLNLFFRLSVQFQIKFFNLTQLKTIRLKKKTLSLRLNKLLKIHCPSSTLSLWFFVLFFFFTFCSRARSELHWIDFNGGGQGRESTLNLKLHYISSQQSQLKSVIKLKSSEKSEKKIQKKLTDFESEIENKSFRTETPVRYLPFSELFNRVSCFVSF